MKYIVCSAWLKDKSNGVVNIQSGMRTIDAVSIDEAAGKYLLSVSKQPEFDGYQICHPPLVAEIEDAPQDISEEKQAST